MAFHRKWNPGCRTPAPERCPGCDASMISEGPNGFGTYRCGGHLYGDRWLRSCGCRPQWAGTQETDAAAVAAMRAASEHLQARIDAFRAAC